MNIEINRNAIVLVSIGEFEFPFLDQLLSAVKERFFKQEVSIADANFDTSGFSYSPTRNQYEAGPILERLEIENTEYTRVLGVTDYDIYVPSLDYIIGQSVIGGPAIVSVARLDPRFWGQNKDDGLFFERVVKEITHELGHTYGMEHCDLPECVMRFSSNYMDTDKKGSLFCEVHQKQLVEIMEKG
jgi:archaemetzincin